MEKICGAKERHLQQKEDPAPKGVLYFVKHRVNEQIAVYQTAHVFMFYIILPMKWMYVHLVIYFKIYLTTKKKKHIGIYHYSRSTNRYLLYLSVA